MTGIVEFIKARLDEDEAFANASTPGQWRYNPNKYWQKPGTSWSEEAVFAGEAGSDAICVAGTGEVDDLQSMADAAHIARHDPLRVLREVAAKRVIVETASQMADLGDWWTKAKGALILRELAAAYSDHPDHRAGLSIP